MTMHNTDDNSRSYLKFIKLYCHSRYGFNSEGHDKVYNRLKVREVEPPVVGKYQNS